MHHTFFIRRPRPRIPALGLYRPAGRLHKPAGRTQRMVLQIYECRQGEVNSFSAAWQKKEKKAATLPEGCSLMPFLFGV